MTDPAPPPLLPRVTAGEPRAVDACVDRYANVVWWLANRYLSRRADAEEAVQEVFFDLWRGAGRFDPAVASEKTFVLTVARRRLIDRRRRQSARPETLRSPPERVDGATGPCDRAASADESARARCELEKLPGDQRRVIELAVDGGLSQSEIAARTGLPLGTVKSHARRGLTALRDRLTARRTPPAPVNGAAPVAVNGEVTR